MTRFAAMLVAAMLAPSLAHAYIDPGTGSYLVQAVVAAVMGGLMAVKLYWQRIKGIFGRGGDDGDPPHSTDPSRSDGK